MSRVEETNEALQELNKEINDKMTNRTSAEAAIGMILMVHVGVTEQMAKSLAQLADDIHFIRETTAKEKEV